MVEKVATSGFQVEQNLSLFGASDEAANPSECGDSAPPADWLDPMERRRRL
jgi:hypothetical protein